MGFLAPSEAPKVLEVAQVSPPDGSVPETAVPLTLLDVVWLHLSPVERLFFYAYPHPTSHFLTNDFPTLKSSLSLCLQHFFPLCGNIRLTPGTADKYEIHYIQGDSVPLTVAECDGSFSELWKDEPREMSALTSVAPKMPQTKPGTLYPVLAIQVTVFPNQGLVFGFLSHHSAADGRAMSNFIRAWASTTLLGGDSCIGSALPVFDRGLMPDFHDLYSNTVKHLPHRNSHVLTAPQEGQKEVVMETFRLGQEHIRQLKAMVSREAETRQVEVKVTTFVVTYAYVWLGFVRARQIAKMSDTASLVFMADLRARAKPAISEKYFGNCIGPCFAPAPLSDLMGENGLFVACAALSSAIAELNRLGMDSVPSWGKQYMALAGSKPLSAAGSPSFEFYSVDFGFGRPLKVEIPSVSEGGAMALAESRREEGGVEIGLAWPTDEMYTFRSYFYNGLQHLS